MALKNVTEDSFEQDVLTSDKPVPVDFRAAWCGPCRRLTPSLEAIAAEHGDKIETAPLVFVPGTSTTVGAAGAGSGPMMMTLVPPAVVGIS